MIRYARAQVDAEGDTVGLRFQNRGNAKAGRADLDRVSGEAAGPDEEIAAHNGCIFG